MRYKQLGNTGLFVSELCPGTMTHGPPGQALGAAVMAAAFLIPARVAARGFPLLVVFALIISRITTQL